MRTEKLLGLVPVFAVLFAGCGSGTVEEGGAKGEAAERRESPPPIDISLADLLNAPRADLAARAEETADRVRLQAKAQEDGRQARLCSPDSS